MTIRTTTNFNLPKEEKEKYEYGFFFAPSFVHVKKTPSKWEHHQWSSCIESRLAAAQRDIDDYRSYYYSTQYGHSMADLIALQDSLEHLKAIKKLLESPYGFGSYMTGKVYNKRGSSRKPYVISLGSTEAEISLWDSWIGRGEQ